MHNFFRSRCERLLRIPDVPEPPPGDEASTRLFRAAPNFYKYLMFEWAAGTIALVTILLLVEIVLLAAIFALVRERGIVLLLFALLALILAVALLARIFALVLVRLDFEKRWYLVTDRSLRVREGIFNVREMTITFANIQNVAISQGPIQRAIGIADLRVDTAGDGATRNGKSHRLRLRVPNQKIVELRTLIGLPIGGLMILYLLKKRQSPINPVPSSSRAG
jgi:membrane protein YdbS with pleckstrin-like domain